MSALAKTHGIDKWSQRQQFLLDFPHTHMPCRISGGLPSGLCRAVASPKPKSLPSTDAFSQLHVPEGHPVASPLNCAGQKPGLPLRPPQMMLSGARLADSTAAGSTREWQRQPPAP